MGILHKYHRPDIIDRRQAADFCMIPRPFPRNIQQCHRAGGGVSEKNEHYIVDFLGKKEYNTAGQAGRQGRSTPVSSNGT